jgi:hypothetical protein
MARAENTGIFCQGGICTLKPHSSTRKALIEFYKNPQTRQKPRLGNKTKPILKTRVAQAQQFCYHLHQQRTAARVEFVELAFWQRQSWEKYTPRANNRDKTSRTPRQSPQAHYKPRLGAQATQAETRDRVHIRILKPACVKCLSLVKIS